MKKIKTSIMFLILVVALGFYGGAYFTKQNGIVHAAASALNCSAPANNQEKCQCGDAAVCLAQGSSSGEIINVIKWVITVLSGAVMVAAVIILIIGAIQYSAAGGDPNGVKAAKTKITNVLIGVVAYVFLYAFLQWIIPGKVFPW